ncbi:TMhelix containing protein [Vibrio phage 1.101.O._10N.261.45.C6]|nr:TMhelix containing protein [Vibrio phage 1.101.O._10N.261.45.C6]
MEEIKSYKVSFKFDSSYKKLQNLQNSQKKFQQTTKRFTERQQKQQRASNTLLADMLKKEEAMVKAQSKIESAKRRQAVGGITSPTGAEGMKAYYKELEKTSLKSEKARIASEKKISDARVKQATEGITAPSGASGMREYYKKLEKEENSRVQRLKTANEAIERDRFMLGKVSDIYQKNARDAIRERTAKASTAQEVRKIVAEEKQRAVIARKQSAEMQKQNFLLRRMRSSSEQLAGNMVGAFAAAGVSVGITSIGQDLEAVDNSLLAISGSTEKAASEMKFLSETAYTMGIPLKETAKDYSKLFAAANKNITVQETRDLFYSLAQASMVLGTSADDTSGILKALGQMLSKTKIQAEELRQQLGDRMPIAMQAITEASIKAGVVTDKLIEKYGSATAAVSKLMEEGKLMSSELLPYFGREIKQLTDDGFEKAMKSNRVAMGRFKNTLESTANLIFKSGWSEGLTELFDSSDNSLQDLVDLFKALGKIAGSIFKAISGLFKVITPVLESFGYVLRVVTDLLGNFSAVALAAFSPAIWGGLALAIKDFPKLKAAIMGVMAPFAKFLLIVTGIIGGLEELVNMFTKEKIGLLYDPRNPERNIIENVFEKDFESGSMAQAGTGMLSNLLGGQAYMIKNIYDKLTNPSISPTTTQQQMQVLVPLQVDGETLGTAVIGTNSFSSGVEQELHPYLTGGRY